MGDAGRHVPYPRLALACAVVALACVVGKAAAEDGLKLAVSESFVYDTNPLMLSSNDSAIYGSETNLVFGYNHETERSLFNTDLSLVRSQFNESAFTTTDAYLRTDMRTSTQRLTLALKGGFAYDTNRSSEFSSSLFSLTAQRQTTWNLDPTLTYSLSARTALALSGSLLERSYEDPALTDYRTISVSPALLYNVTPLQVVSFSLQARDYHTLSGTDRSVESLGPYLGWRYRFMPEYSVEVFGGFMGSRTNGFGTQDDGKWTYNPVYSASLVYRGEQHTASLGVSRARQAYADGTDSYLTNVKADDTVKLTPRWTLNAAGVYQFADQSASTGSQLHTAWEGSAALTYKAAEHWKVSLSQRYRQETFFNNRDDASRDIVRVGLTYNFGRE